MTHRATAFSLFALAALVAACSSRGGLVPPATAQPIAQDASAARKATLDVTLNLSRQFARADRFTITAYVLPSSGPAATPPPASLVTSFKISDTLCPANAGVRTCRFAARVPAGSDAIVANLYGKSSVIDNAFVALSVGPTPAGIAFRTGGAAARLSVVTPLLGNAGDFRVAVTPIDSDGFVILNDNAATKMAVRVYAPQGTVKGASDGQTSYVGGAGVSAAFRYSGAAFANAMTVAATRGTSSITGQIFPARTPAPRVCANLGDLDSVKVDESSPVANGFYLQMSIAGGKRTRVQLDTGSTGLLINAAYLKGTDGAQLTGPGQSGQETLEPSGITLKGNYYLAAVTLYGNGAKIGTTVPMEVLVVKTACAKSGACKPDTGTSYLGVGFGRPAPPPTSGYLKSPLENALLQLSAIVRGTMHPGYILSNDALSIGVNRSNAAGYAFTRLAPFAGRPGDWQTPPGCIGFNGAKPQCGSMLLDIGIGTMFVSAPTPNPITEISIAAPDTERPSLAYSFAYPVEPGATPPAPNPKVSAPIGFVQPGATPFFNTGRGPLAIRSYLYDAGCGRTGFRSYPSRTTP